MEIARDTTFNNRYRLLNRVGEGGMAVVYRAYDQALDRVVALKVLRRGYGDDVTFLSRFRREARAAAKLDHPNIVTVFDVGQDGDWHYIVMEYVEGRNLKDEIRDGAPFRVGRALDMAIQVCAAVGYAHRAGLVHCDLKPQNVLVAGNGRVKVTDFGIARALSSAPQDGVEVVWGTPQYSSPEQAAGKPPTSASDVYAIGIMLYEMLAGELPFTANDAQALSLKHLKEEPPALSGHNPRVPLHVEQIVHRVLSKDPAKRYGTADQLGRILIACRRQGEEATQPLQPVARGEAGHAARPVFVEETALLEEARGPDRVAWALGAAAFLAVMGLFPLWGLVYRRYALSPPMITPAPPITATPLAPTATTGIVVTPAPGEVIVPDLVGMDQETARQTLARLGLDMSVVGEEYHPNIPALSVVSQLIPAGQPIKGGESVGVIISQGPRLVTVPQAVGAPISMIEPVLTELGLIVMRQEVWSLESQGVVVAQEPAAGAVVTEGSTIMLTVSAGPRVEIGANLDDKVLLVACDLEAEQLRPGDTLHLTLYWRALQAMNESYMVFVHLTRADGTIVAQLDSEPRGGRYPTTRWTVNEQVSDPYDLTVPTQTEPGLYWVWTGMYIPGTMHRLPVLDPGQSQAEGNGILIRRVQVIGP
jgi:tRNA A-37 threonylcarbamoyl transferase component Bud32